MLKTFAYPTCMYLTLNLKVRPLELGEIWRQKTIESWGFQLPMPYSEEMIVDRTMWAQSTSVTDGQTARQIYDDYKTVRYA